jgi:adenylate kinase
MRLIFIGPPGVGKGTQAKRICDHFGILHLSTGDLLRDEISKNTEIGIEAKTFIDAGQLVPDDVLLKMMSIRLAQNDCEKGYCLDGFPRTIPQAEGLSTIMNNLDHALDAVVSIDADEEELVDRLVLRGQTSGRSDDTPDVIRQRLNVYKEQTEPLIQYYRSSKLVKDVNGIGEIEEITEKILNNLN